MFANGTEYDCFIELNCDNCKNYVLYDDASESNPVCKIEEAISLSGFWITMKQIKCFRISG